jgi:transcriptional regulator with XRE-family HTH domain
MTREELLKSKEFWLTQIQNGIFNLIEQYRNDKNLNKTQLAAELGVTKGYITQVLNGDFDHKVSKLVDLSLAFHKVPVISYINLEEYVKNDAADKTEYMLVPIKNYEALQKKAALSSKTASPIPIKKVKASSRKPAKKWAAVTK